MLTVNYESLTELRNQAADKISQGTVLAQVAQKVTKTTKNGNPYLEVTLTDTTGSITLKVWENAPWSAGFHGLQEGDAIALSATWQSNQYGLEMTDAEFHRLSEEEEQALLAGGPQLRERQNADWEDILRLTGSIRDPRLRTLCEHILQAHENRIRRSAAARGFHHARRGGLVEHSAGVMRAADAICNAYPQLNRDLVLSGALLHDIGKLLENSYPEHSLVMPYTEPGELLGHITIGIEMVNKVWAKITGATEHADWQKLSPSTEQVRLHLLHLIASHHGSLEFGSPVVPKTPEAFALNIADNLDAKMEMFRGAYETSPALAATIQQRKNPLPGNTVTPLPHFSAEA